MRHAINVPNVGDYADPDTIRRTPGCGWASASPMALVAAERAAAGMLGLVRAGPQR